MLDLSGRRQCRLMAISRSPGHVAGTTALPPATDIRAPKSAFALISSAVPPGADSQDGGADGPEVTQSGSRQSSTPTAMTTAHPVASRSPDRTGMCCVGRGTPQCSKWPMSRASDRKISPMKKEIAMQTTGSWTNLRATATGATVLGNWRSHLGNLGSTKAK